MLKLKIPTAAELRRVYQTDLTASFLPMELKPFSSIQAALEKGKYLPFCLFDDNGAILGECFLWLGNPGWALLDYLCVTPKRRNEGLGALILQEMLALEPSRVVLGESEAPAAAPDKEMALRRLDFYKRNGAHMAGYDTELFHVHYKTLYWSEDKIQDELLIKQHQEIYQLASLPDKFKQYVCIPRIPS